MDTPKRVLVVDNSADLLELNRILLTAEGYEVVTSGYDGADLAFVKSCAPHVILIDLVKDRPEPWALLEETALDPDTRDIGVMVTSATPDLIEKALGDANLHVSNGLLMPFDIDDLYTHLEEAISRTEASPATAPRAHYTAAAQAAAQCLGQERQNIVFRWVQRISTFEAYRHRPDLPLSVVVGEMGALLDGLIAGLEANGATALPARLDELVRRHVALRVVHHVPAAEIVREYQALRAEVGRCLHGAAHLWRMDLGDTLAAYDLLEEAIDRLVVLSVEECERQGVFAAREIGSLEG